MAYQCSDSEYARRYDRSPATIKKYREEKLPLDNPAAMAKILEVKAAARINGGRMLPSNPDAQTGDDTTPPGKRTIFTITNDIKEVELETKRHKLYVAQGKLIDREAVRQAGLKIGSDLDHELKKLENDIPSTCAGLDHVELQKRISAYLLTLRKNVKKSLADTATAFNLESVN